MNAAARGFRKSLFTAFGLAVFSLSLIAGCGNSEAPEPTSKPNIEQPTDEQPGGGSTANDGSTDGGGGSSGGGSSGGGGITGGNPEADARLQGITAAHNAARAAVSPAPATPMAALKWSTTIAATAQAWANKCQFKHSSGTYGENIYADTGQGTAADVVEDWVSEKQDYNYSTNRCSGVCGHYTQVVWAKSINLGCAVTRCTTNSPFGGGAWNFWVCNYDPAGNFNGQRPY